MKYVTYNQVKTLRFAAVCVCLVFIFGAFLKLYYNYSKIESFKKGEEFYKLGKVVAAEDWFVKARSQIYFEYNESTVSNRLGELKYVTDLKEFIKNLSEIAKKANTSENVEVLIGEYNKYTVRYSEETKKGKQKQVVFEEISKDYNIEESFKKYFETAKGTLKAKADNNIKSKNYQNEDFKKIILKMPAFYYGGEEKKKQEINKFIMDYDNRKIDTIAKYTSISQATFEAGNVIEYNKKNSNNYKWVIDKMEILWTDVITKDVNSSNYDSMLNHYKEYELFIKQYLPKSGVLAIVNDKIKSDYSAANKYSSDGSFVQAMDLYKKISLFKDVKSDMNRTQLKWIEKEPIVVLNTAFPDKKFKNVQSGLNAWGYPVYALACDDKGTLYLTLVSADCQYLSITVKTFADNNNDIKSLKVMGELDRSRPIVVAEASSSNKKSEYVGYTVSNEGFKEVFRFEADGFIVEGKDRLLVDNPTGQGAGMQCYYTLKDGYYSFYEVKKDYTTITLDKIYEHKNEKVGFSCNILKYDDVYNMWAIGTDGKIYVLLKNFKYIGPGNIYIIGKYSGEETIYKDNKQITVPGFNVSEVVGS